MPDPGSPRSSPGRALGRVDLMLEDERSSTVVIIDVICRCDDITVQLGSQTLAVIDRKSFTDWLWRRGRLVADDLALSVEGTAVFAVINGGRPYVCPPGSVEKLTELIANSG